MKKPLTVSIVIPVYNEENHLKICLDAIATQTQKPDEVIVVDNNSRDNSVAIARNYPFVTVVPEAQQGILYARDKGFNSATCDVIGRIDADTRLPSTWVEQVKDYFGVNPHVGAISSDNYFYDFPFRRSMRWLHSLIYFRMQGLLAGTTILWGSNMAVRRENWAAVANAPVLPQDHEDLDLMLKLKHHGVRIDFVPQLRAEVSLRHGNYKIVDTASYLWSAVMTYIHNGAIMSGVACFVLLFTVYLLLLPVMAVHESLRLLRFLMPAS